ncbi:MAG TPA: CHAT domain-containing tetratricopeptide repeat protein [Pyrinomonadaceae bacterium]|nr:CHAT domain-containing tetratricopeptide repeat protein [Pyrinomonadaceae bacterium]
MKSRVFFMWAIICLLALQVAPQTQDENILTRHTDEGARTREDRQRALSILLAAGHQSAGSDSLQAARSFNRAGRLQLRLNSSQEALGTYQHALNLLKDKPDSTEAIDLRNGIADAYTSLSQCDKARGHISEAISSSQKRGYVNGHAEALLNLSKCQDFSDHALAITTARKSLELSQSVGNMSGVAHAYSSLSEFQLAHSDIIEATESSEAALKLWRELNMPDEEAAALITLGFLEYRKGAWQSCLSFLVQAQSLLDEKAEPYKMGRISAGIAEAFIESGMPEIGLTKSQQSREYYRLAEDPRGITVMTWEIGKSYYLLGNYAEALKALQQARDEATAMKDPLVVAMCHDFSGRTYGASGDQSSAFEHFQIALKLYTQIGNPREAARTRALIGQVYERLGQVDKARQYYQTALEAFGKLVDRVNESAALYALGRLELKENSLDLAEGYLRRSIDVTENIRRVSTSGDLMAAFSATVQDRYESYIDCLMRQSLKQTSNGLAVRAFETSELSRARSLTELLRATQTALVPGINPQLAEQEKLLRQSLKAKEDAKVSLLAREYTKSELLSLDLELARLEIEYKKVNQLIREQHPSYQQVTGPTAWDLRQIQEQVVADDQTVLLEYSLGLNRSYVWAVTRNDIKSYELPAQEKINEAAQKVYQLSTSPEVVKSAGELTQAIRELSRLVLAPVAAELNKKRMIVVADGALHYIPFQMLTVASGSDEPLVATTEVINAPSASILGQLRQETGRRKAPTNILAAFGDPVFASNYAQRKDPGRVEYVAAVQPQDGARWRQALRNIEPVADAIDPAAIQPLFYTKRELSNLKDVAGPGTFLATGFDATPETLKSTDLTKYAILHFATHGILDPKRPENSGFFLSMVNREGKDQNGFVGLQDIYGLHAPVDLVVLSACRTGLGKDVRGEGLIGLTRGFMYAGASRVVASLWKVDDEATAELMKRFYANMLQGHMPPSTALRAAQNSIREQPQWSAPYYWAAFTLQGEHLRIIKPTQRGGWQIYQVVFSVVALAGVVTIGFWWFFNRPARRATRGQTTIQP